MADGAGDGPEWYHPTDFEVATGWVSGYLDPPVGEIDERAPEHPLDALRALVLPALLEPPAVVRFSGGRDSSALLAVCMDVARREGLPVPLPMTEVYPGVPESREDEWQELVIRHLGIRDWHRVEIDDDMDLLGPTGSASLLEHGLLWPAPVHLDDLTLRAAPGRFLITGNGGDEVFGRHRVQPLARLLAGQRPGERGGRQVAATLAPRSVRRHLAQRQQVSRDMRPWLLPEAKGRLALTVREDAVHAPLSWARSLSTLPLRRGWVLGTRNMSLKAAVYGRTNLHPLVAPRFLRALGRHRGWRGYTSRTAAMTDLFGTLLPAPLVQRGDKAGFGSAYVSDESRRFIREWSDEGMNRELVDPTAVRAALDRPRPHGLALLLLQQGWLAARGGGRTQKAAPP